MTTSTELPAAPASTETTTAATTTVTTPDAVKIEPKKTTKSIVLNSTGGGSDYSNLKYIDEEYPKFDKTSDCCVIKVKACGLNFAELMQRQGLYKPQNKTPYTPGFEGAGIIEECGEKCVDLAVNDRVMYFCGSGAWKDMICVPRDQIVKIPNTMTFEEAAGMFVNYVTAYQVLYRCANIREGDSVLIHMAAGGVGTAATQLCKMIPNVTVFGTASQAKHEYIKKCGVDHPIDYTCADYVEEVKKISGGEGVDIVLDPLNGEQSIKGYDLLKPFGRIVHYGVASMTSENRSLVNAFKAWWKCLSVSSIDIMAENKTMSGYHLGVLMNSPSGIQKTKTDLTILMKWFEEKKLKVEIDSFFSFSKVGEAMRRMHARKNMGKIILLPDSEMMTSEVAANKVNTLIPVKEPKKKLISVSTPSTDSSSGDKQEPKTPEGECDDKETTTSTNTKKKSKKNKDKKDEVTTTPVTTNGDVKAEITEAEPTIEK